MGLILTIIIGILIGAIFPLSLLIYIGKEKTAGKSVGMISASDHIGAAIGAFFIGSIFLPVLGISNTCLLLAILPTLAATLLFLSLSMNKKREKVSC